MIKGNLISYNKINYIFAAEARFVFSYFVYVNIKEERFDKFQIKL